ncbi:Cation/H+ exchanger [Poronia punctata]|nr:Cation/H+ exchanger [Poronia punctata]
MPTLDLSEVNKATAVIGSFMAIYGLLATKIRSVWYLGEALPAVAFGIILGPVGAKFMDPGKWGEEPPGQVGAITLGVMRVMISIQLVIAGYQLPAKYVQRRWREVFVCLVPVMALMWLCTSVCILSTIPNLSLLATLVIGACATSTDPILSQAVAKGPFAEKYVSRPLREIISAEAGANDGFASPFLMLSVNLLRLSASAPDSIVERHRGVGPRPSHVGMALGNWAIETLVYIVLLATVYGAVSGFCARTTIRFSLSRGWIDTESYFLYPTALGLFVVGTCGAIGTSDLLACFVAGCALNWDGRFLAETKRRHDEVDSCIDVLLNFGGFLYVGAVLPWKEFHQPETTGITYPRLVALGALVLLFRRIPALLITYKLMPSAVKDWREAIFMGHFGPIGVGAVYYVEHTRLLFNQSIASEKALIDALRPVVFFLVLTSIVVHGLSIPILSVAYKCRRVKMVTEDCLQLYKRSTDPPTSVDAVRGHRCTFITYGRFRPLANLSLLPIAHAVSSDGHCNRTMKTDNKDNENGISSR